MSETMDVAVVKLGLDASARAEVQAAMDAIARSGDTSSPAGLVQMLREAVAVLRGVEAAWTHGAVESHAPMPPAKAEATFGEAAKDARERFEHEVIRAAHGKTVTKAAPKSAPSSEPSMVVVTIVLAARRALRDVATIDRASFRLALDDLVVVGPAELVALDVIWSPADPDDRPSVAEVERNYPELTRFGAEVG